MSQKKYIVRIFLTDKCSDSVEQILHGDGCCLGPTFDGITQEALMYDGDLEDWEPTCCDYSFSNEKDVSKFIYNVKEKFSDSICLEYVSIPDSDNFEMRTYPSLPNTLVDRIAAITPKSIKSLNVKIAVANDEFSLSTNDGYHGVTYANTLCKITGKIRSEKVILRSGPKMIDEIFSKLLPKHLFDKELQSAEKAGWTKNDISYDALINGLLVKDIDSDIFNGESCPEMLYASTTIVVVVFDYDKDQFVGWFFYNENLDDLLKFTNCPVG